jgi:geranylgeranyl pyrophosphate synthase
MTNEETLDLDKFYENNKEELEQKIIDMISDKKIYSILEGGKRLRPLLASLSFKACTQGKETKQQYDQAVEGGVVIELAHAASLVHDDIIDQDNERRGKPAFHIKEGIGKAILTGHKMLATGFDITLRHGREIAKLYMQSWGELVNGEIDEVSFNKSDLNKLKEQGSKSQIFEAYRKIIDLKTAALFSSACKAGAMEANMTGDILNVFEKYGREIGLAYQLADDLVDLANGEMIDSVIVPLLNRLKQGKIKISAFKQREIKKEFEKNKDKIQEFYIEEIKKHVKNAEELGHSNLIPNSKYKSLLQNAPSFIINKMLREINITV